MAERLVFRVHALQRMFQRGLSAADVQRVLDTGRTIERYTDDRPYPSRLVLGWLGTQPIHVVVADNRGEEETIAITVYEPDPARWEPGFQRRRRT